MKTFLIALRAVFFGAGFVFLWGWVALSVRTLDPALGFSLPEWAESPGLVFMVVGGALVLLCAGTFIVRGRGTPAVFDPPRRFVAVGPYKHVRNPMYIGGLILLDGFGLVERSFSILLLSLVWFILVHLFVVFYEEPNLRARFGSPYTDYCKAVRRWVPRW